MSKPSSSMVQDRRTGIIVIWLVTLLASAKLASGQNTGVKRSPAPVASLEPGELIKLLPVAPDQWKLTASHAQNEVSSATGSETFAIRNYLYIPPVDLSAQPGLAPPIPQKTQITLLDTGFDPSAISEFVDFKPGFALPHEKNVRRFSLSGYPAILRTLESGKLKLTISLALRFNVYVELEQQPETNFEKWVAALNLPMLAQTAATVPRSSIPLHQMRISNIDELNPKLDTSRMEAYITPAEQEAVDKAARDRAMEAEKRLPQQ